MQKEPFLESRESRDFIFPFKMKDIGLGFPVRMEDCVEFHLIYSGTLHASGSIDEKHQIRRAFHAQLKRLWETDPNLKRMAEQEGRIFYSREISGQETAPPLSQDEAINKGITKLGEAFQIGAIPLVPLVTEKLSLRCRLEVLFLRREERNFVIQGGDIDARLKTLFDGLRRPRLPQEIPKSYIPVPEESPMFCLLEDDALISDVRIDTGQLLMLPTCPDPHRSEVYLQIGVKLAVKSPSLYDWVF